MEKKTIGEFIAALRKANGLTQQEVADRLNVSNKAVSRWERDDCAPDISLIPALAELFGVTCDELLKGERIFNVPQSEKSKPKVEKQMKLLVNREISRFKTLIWIALALALTGIVGTLCITYGFFRPVIGFCVMILFELAAIIMTAIAVNRMNETKSNSELFDGMSVELKRKYRKVMGKLTFTVISIVVSAITLSLPLLLASNGFMVITLNSYFTIYFLPIALSLCILILFTYKPCVALISGEEVTREKKNITKPQMMNLIQLLSLFIAGLLLLLSPYTISRNSEMSDTIDTILTVIAFIFLCLDVLLFIIFMVRYRSERREFLLPGIRNLLLLIPCFLLDCVHHVSFSSTNPGGESIQWENYDIWNMEWGYIALLLALAIVAAFQLIAFFKSTKKND